MKQTILVLSLLSVVFTASAQNFSGEVWYQKESLRYLSQEEDFLKEYEKRPDFLSKVSLIDKNTKLILEDLRFKLTFNKHESMFKADEYLELEKNKFYGFATGPEGSAFYYNNLTNEEYLIQKNAFGEKFLIETPKTTWILTNEIKKIEKYRCFKATAVVETKGSKGIIKYDVVAWYAPELNIPFGPLGFSGLPGLIMELECQNTRYTVSKIEINPKEKVVIIKPTTGKKVTKEEFDTIGISVMSNYKKGF